MYYQRQHANRNILVNALAFLLDVILVIALEFYWKYIDQYIDYCNREYIDEYSRTILRRGVSF